MIIAASILSLTLASSAQPAQPLPYKIPVVVVGYYPRAGDKIDIKATGDWGDGYEATKKKCSDLTVQLENSLEEGSRFRGYKSASIKPSLDYQIVGRYEFDRPLPTRPLRAGEKVPMTDYAAIMKQIDGENWVNNKGVKQVWIWGYHGGVLNLWESNMSSPHGDVSNSNRDTQDLPVLKSTYTVYHYNYQRGLGEAIEDHMHQLEALLNHVDGRDTAPQDKWSELLFWGKFVGSDISHKITTNPARCGWTHYAPNSERDYDWKNPRYVETDIEDWKPEGIGKTQRMNAERWDFDPIKWRVYWLQAIPGANHGLTYKGKQLRNWWTFVADWDRAKKEKWTLVAK